MTLLDVSGRPLVSTSPAKAVTGPFAANVTYGNYLGLADRTPQARMRRAQAAYHSNPWVGSAESTVTRRVAGLPWHLEDDQDEEYEEPYPPAVQLAWDLLERPQKALPPELRDPGLLTRRSLLSITSRHLGLCGMAYWFLDGTSGAGIPSSILYVNPARVWAATTETGRITGWVIDPADDYGNGGTPVGLGELLPFYLDPPDWGPYGSGLYERAVQKALITNLADQHAAYVLGTGGRLAGIVSPKEGVIPDEQYAALVREFRNVNEAPDAAKRTTILRGPIDFTRTGADPTQLSLIDISTMNRDEIFTIWGIPPSQAGVPGQKVGLNSGQVREYDEAIFMQGAVHDRVVSIRETIQFGLLDRWLAGGVTIDLEIEEPEFDDKAPQYEIAAKARELPLTNSERRELVGLPPFGDARDEEVWLPATLTPAYGSTMTPPEPPKVSVVPPPQLGPGEMAPEPMPDMMMEGKAAAPREFLGLRRSVDTRWVPAMRRTVTDVLRAQRQEVAAKLRAVSPAEWTRQRKNRQHWFDADKEARRLRKVLAPTAAALAETVVARTQELLSPRKADPFSDAVTSSVTSSVGSRVVGITQTTQDAIAEAIAAGYEDGLSPAEIADLIESLPAFDEARAELVARTETMLAYNEAALRSYGEFGVRMVQAIDGDTDAECAARNGNVYTLDDAQGITDHPNGTLDWAPVLEAA